MKKDVFISVRIDRKADKKLSVICKKNGISKSNMVRALVSRFLEERV